MEINETLMNKINAVKDNVMNEIAEITEYLTMKREDFSTDLQENFVFTQAALVFVWIKDRIQRLNDYLDEELENYTKLETIESRENRYHPHKDREDDDIAISRYLTYLLRHNPSSAGLVPDKNGWVEVSKLLEVFKNSKYKMDLPRLLKIVACDGKGRFAFNEDKTKIRATYGHSIDVNVEMEECVPPNILYHGTAERFLAGIQRKGIKKMERNYVHLSEKFVAALDTGKRHGKSVVLAIDAKRMYADGYKFFSPTRGIWLTDEIPWGYVIEVLHEEG